MITTLRQSSLSTWENCGEMFRRRYIEGEVIPPGLAAHIGTGIHKAAEVNHKAKIVTGRDEPLSVLKDAAVDGYVQAVKNGTYFAPEDQPSARAQAEDGADEVVSLAELYHREVAPEIQPALVEQRVEIKVPELVPSISGTIDVLDTAGTLIDLKTASKAWPADRAHQSHQATIYHKLVEAGTGKPPEEIRFEVMIKGKKSRRQTISTDRTEDDFKALVSRLVIMWNMIMSDIFPPAPAGSWICGPRYCGYFWTCPHIPDHKKILPKSTH